MLQISKVPMYNKLYPSKTLFVSHKCFIHNNQQSKQSRKTKIHLSQLHSNEQKLGYNSSAPNHLHLLSSTKRNQKQKHSKITHSNQKQTRSETNTKFNLINSIIINKIIPQLHTRIDSPLYSKTMLEREIR
jgi:hypothetical protein